MSLLLTDGFCRGSCSALLRCGCSVLCAASSGAGGCLLIDLASVRPDQMLLCVILLRSHPVACAERLDACLTADKFIFCFF